MASIRSAARSVSSLLLCVCSLVRSLCRVAVSVPGGGGSGGHSGGPVGSPVSPQIALARSLSEQERRRRAAAEVSPLRNPPVSPVIYRSSHTYGVLMQAQAKLSWCDIFSPTFLTFVSLTCLLTAITVLTFLRRDEADVITHQLEELQHEIQTVRRPPT